ncbi:MAG: lysophospholipid acyltransferase family protein [Candidatus Riflebacteria bacterium]|nr:lysophospholipid acyltransferase family protein [Candidatus Riflebacteria bacterium]
MIRRTIFSASNLLCRLPEKYAAIFAASVGLAAYNLTITERNKIFDKIDRIYNRANTDLPMPLEQIVKRVYINFAMVLVELLRYPILTSEDLNKKFTFTGLENLNNSLSKNKGVILALPHLGNWEYLGAAIVNKGYKLNSFYLAQKDGGIGEILDHFRTYSKIVLHDRDRGGMAALRALKKNEILGMIADQDGNKNGIYTDFLRHWVSVPAGPANWSLKTGADLLPLYSLRKKMSFNYDAFFLKPFEEEKDAPLPEMAMSRTVKMCNWMEDLILRHPHQYLWFYDRFKARHEAWTTSELNSKEQMCHGTARYTA